MNIHSNWSQLMKNILEDKLKEGSKMVHRILNEDEEFVKAGAGGKRLMQNIICKASPCKSCSQEMYTSTHS